MRRPLPPAALWGIAAGGFALAELLAGLGPGHFMIRGRAEPSLFLAYRPWLLLALVLLVAHRPLRVRWPAYGLALLIASLAEGVLAWQLGGPFPMLGVLRGLIAGAVLALLLDVIVRLIRRSWPEQRWFLPAVVALALLALPGPVRLFETLALPPRADPKPSVKVALLTGLPIIWGELGVDGAMRGLGQPAAVYRLLESHFTMKPIDTIDADAPKREILLVSQPRSPSAYDLTLLDKRVRNGGRALFLLDPSLHWPTTLPLGDPRRPPPLDPMLPLLTHWGLLVETPKGRVDPVDHNLEVAGQPHRVRMLAPGRLRATDGQCRILDRGIVADCAIGKGRAVIVADADFLQDEFWTAPGLYGASREGRLADNGLYVGRWIAALAGIDGFAAEEAVPWADPMESHGMALLFALSLPAACLATGLWQLRPARRRRGSPR